MNENFESTVESSRKTVSDFGTQAKERLLTQVRAEPAKTLSIVLGWGGCPQCVTRLLPIPDGEDFQARAASGRLDARSDRLDQPERSENCGSAQGRARGNKIRR